MVTESQIEAFRRFPNFSFDEKYLFKQTTDGSFPSTEHEITNLKSGTLRRHDELYGVYALAISDGANIQMPNVPIVIAKEVTKVNINKRGKAFTSAIEDIRNNETIDVPPFPTLPLVFATRSIAGMKDMYPYNEHPSREIFAYNRIGKQDFLNRKFAHYCLEMLDIAYPDGEVTERDAQVRIKAHRVIEGTNWAVVSAKQLIEKRQFEERSVSLISRTTGVINLEDERLTEEEHDATHGLVAFQRRRLNGGESTACEQTQLYQAAIRGMLYDDRGLVLPVIQTVYQTQSPI